jgi:hypothetical protein
MKKTKHLSHLSFLGLFLILGFGIGGTVAAPIHQSPIASVTSANPNPPGAKIIQCLRDEQMVYLTKKIYSPEQQVNFELTNELLTYDFFPFKKDTVDNICNTQSSKAVEFLKHLIADKQGFLVFPEELKSKESYIRSQFSEILERSTAIFSLYLTTLQSKAPYDCFNKKIPGINNYLQEYQDTRGEANSEEALSQKERIFKIFNALKNYPDIIAKCEKEAQEQQKKEKLDRKKNEKNERKEREAAVAPASLGF